MQCLGRWPDDDEGLLLGDAARALDVSPDTLRRWERAGKLRTTRDARQPPARAARARSSASRAARPPQRGRPPLGAQPLPGGRALGRDRRRDGAGGDRGGPAPGHRGGDPRRRRGARAGAGRARHGDRQGHIGDGRARDEAALAVVVAARARARRLRRRRRRRVGSSGDEQAAPGRVGRRLDDRGARPRAAPSSPTRTCELSFAGSDELAAQIRQGVKPDVYAAANTKLPDAALRRGAARASRSSSRPTSFVLAVPKDSEIDSVEDLTADGVKIAIGVGGGADRLLHARGARRSCPPRRRRRSSPTCARTSPT